MIFRGSRGVQIPSSAYRVGREAPALIERSRAEVAAAINASPQEVVFTSGATEGNNHVLRMIHALRRAAYGAARAVGLREAFFFANQGVLIEKQLADPSPETRARRFRTIEEAREAVDWEAFRS